jgi:hypothetical protein
VQAAAGIVAASTTVAGKVELATSAETATGTATDLAVTPEGAKDTYFPLAGGTVTPGNVAIPSASFGANNALTGAVADARFSQKTQLYVLSSNFVINNTGLTDVTGFAAADIDLEANSTYLIEWYFAMRSESQGVSLTLKPSYSNVTVNGTSFYVTNSNGGTPSIRASYHLTSSGWHVANSAMNADSATWGKGRLVTTTSPTMAIQFGQTSPTEENSTVAAGSWLALTKQ